MRGSGPSGNKNDFLRLIVNTDHNNSVVKSRIERRDTLSNVKLGGVAMDVSYGPSIFLEEWLRFFFFFHLITNRDWARDVDSIFSHFMLSWTTQAYTWNGRWKKSTRLLCFLYTRMLKQNRLGGKAFDILL